jgi:uncharacterized protein
MYYVDTSVLAAYYCPEILSNRVQAFLSAQINPAISNLTDVELFSAVSRKVRMGELSHADGNRILSKFQAHLTSNLYRVIPIEMQHWRIARGWLSLFNTPLRTLDALHLAVASAEGLILYTSDRQLISSANALGIQCEGAETNSDTGKELTLREKENYISED